MNEKANELNADEREHLAKLIAMDVNDMRDTHIEALKARRDYLTGPERERFPFLNEESAPAGDDSSESKKPRKVKKSAPLDEQQDGDGK